MKQLKRDQRGKENLFSRKKEEMGNLILTISYDMDVYDSLDMI